ncbi:hypothetical protein M5689_007948 [Euphorbia peplus]|nr:hypothetical protein M5689_007948 [Euphorbia peplus]
MVKPQVKSFIFIFCMLILCVSVLAEEKNEKWCTIRNPFRGSCEDESEVCVKDFIKKYGESKKPKNCSCKNLLPKNHLLKTNPFYTRVCWCEILCNE